MNSRIRMRDPHGQRTPPNVFTDFDWIHRHKKQLLEQYGERSIIVYHEQVIGVGDTYEAALEDAEHHLPNDGSELTPVHYELHYRHPFLKVRPTQK